MKVFSSNIKNILKFCFHSKIKAHLMESLYYSEKSEEDQFWKQI